jgi:hypothetical protein
MHDRADEIVKRAIEYIDRPYRHQGRSWETGVDCAGLPICIGVELGLFEFNTHPYTSRPNIVLFNAEIRRSGCKQIPKAEMASGDIVQLATQGWPVHCGIVVVDEAGQAWIIHALAHSRKVIRDPITPEKDLTITTVWRYP